MRPNPATDAGPRQAERGRFGARKVTFSRNQTSRRGFYSGKRVVDLGAPIESLERAPVRWAVAMPAISDRGFRPKTRLSPWRDYCSRLMGRSSREALLRPADSTMCGEISPFFYRLEHGEGWW